MGSSTKREVSKLCWSVWNTFVLLNVDMMKISHPGRQLGQAVVMGLFCSFLWAAHLFKLKCHISGFKEGQGHLSNHCIPAEWKSLLPGAWGTSPVDSPNVTLASKRQIIPMCLLCMVEESHCSATSLFAEIMWFPMAFLILSDENQLRNWSVLSSSKGFYVPLLN